MPIHRNTEFFHNMMYWPRVRAKQKTEMYSSVCVCVCVCVCLGGGGEKSVFIKPKQTKILNTFSKIREIWINLSLSPSFSLSMTQI